MFYLSFAVYFAAIFMAGTGVTIIHNQKEESLRFHNRFISRGRVLVKRYFDNGYMPEFEPAGLKVKQKTYEMYRAAVSLWVFLMWPITGIPLFAVLGVLLYIIWTPRMEFKGIIMPYGILINMLVNAREKKKEGEIYEGLCLIRNHIAVSQKKGTGTDPVLAQLIQHSDAMKQAYVKMLSAIRVNDREGALAGFIDELGERRGADYGRLLLQLDELSIEECEEVMISYQRSLREARLTEMKRKDEIVSDIIYLPVVVNTLLVFVNFIYVAYFISQQGALEGIF